jgi:Uma2 family endonuclease
MADHPEPLLMTVEEYYQLPERDDVILELHWGSLVELARPRAWHVDLQDCIAQLLRARCGLDWRVRVELPFRALPQYELRAVDVGVVAKSRWDVVRDGYLFGSPEIVVEILSPSNRPGKIAERMALFLSTGTQQFCLVDWSRRSVSVTGLDNKTLVYKTGDEIPFPLLGACIKVSEIFAELS